MLRTGRHLIAAMGLICVALLFDPGHAGADTDFDSLNDSAIMIVNLKTTSLVAIARAGQRLVAAGQHGAVIYSDDNGTSWKQAKVPVDLILTALYFTSPTQGWAVGNFGVVLHTADGGLRWVKVIDGNDIIRALDNASMQAQATTQGSPEAALALRVATAFRAAGPTKPFLAFGTCAGNLLAVGQQDMAMLSSDNGKTWQQWVSNTANPQFRDIYDIVDDGNATFLIGESGLVLKSMDKCLNFASVSGLRAATLFGAARLGFGKLLIYGLQGGVYLTSDSGTTWRTIDMPQNILIDSAVELASGRVVLSTLDGHLYISDAALLNFRVLQTSEPFEIADMILAPNGDLVIVGNGGVAVVSEQLLN